MGEKSVAQKARVKPGTSIGLIDPAPGVVDSLGLPHDVEFVDPRDAQLVFLFVRDRSELESKMPAALAVLSPGAAIWVFFRKGARSSGLDMNRNDVWAMAEREGMRPLGLVSVDDTWTAFRLRHADPVA